jgi:hypothetical protein
MSWRWGKLGTWLYKESESRKEIYFLNDSTKVVDEF